VRQPSLELPRAALLRTAGSSDGARQGTRVHGSSDNVHRTLVAARTGQRPPADLRQPLHFLNPASNVSASRTAPMPSRRAKWFLTVLAALVNLGGGPMAWAHLAASGKCHESVPPAVQMSPDCPQHHSGAHPNKEHPQAPHSLPCCDGGSCACAAPPSISASVSLPQSSQVVIVSTPEPRLTAAPSTILDDALRPPIY
jgi:hypothetical protein